LKGVAFCGSSPKGERPVRMWLTLKAPASSWSRKPATFVDELFALAMAVSAPVSACAPSSSQNCSPPSRLVGDKASHSMRDFLMASYSLCGVRHWWRFAFIFMHLRFSSILMTNDATSLIRKRFLVRRFQYPQNTLTISVMSGDCMMAADFRSF